LGISVPENTLDVLPSDTLSFTDLQKKEPSCTPKYTWRVPAGSCTFDCTSLPIVKLKVAIVAMPEGGLLCARHSFGPKPTMTVARSKMNAELFMNKVLQIV
jgi:hypothetical protein